MEKKISLCITTYNRAERVVKCIESAVNQTMDNDDYEIIIVDDASTDNTKNLVQNIKIKYPENNIKFILLDKNTGNASIPRNTAIHHAKGEYILFIDSDDYINEHTAVNAYEFAKENNSDIVYLKFGLGSDFGNVPKAFSSKGTLKNADIIDNRLLFSLSAQKLFKLSEIKRLNLKFDPEVTIGEDMLFTVEFLFNTKVHSVLADQDYYIFVHHNSDRLTSSKVNIQDSFSNYQRILKLISEGTYKNEDYRARASARFMHRTLSSGRGGNKYYLKPGCPKKSTDEFYKEFQQLLEGFPIEWDKFLSQQYKNEIFALRTGDLLGQRLSIDVYDLKMNNKQNEKNIQTLNLKNKELQSEISDLKKQIGIQTQIEALKKQIDNLESKLSVL